jgi:hypothetical protein
VRPRSLTSTPRGVRRNSAKPISSSRSLICSLTADCDTFSLAEARVKLRSLATDRA